MGEMSGFPLWQVLRDACPSVQVVEWPVPKEIPASPPPSILIRVLRKIGFVKPIEFSQWPCQFDPLAGSPWATPRHEYAAKQALQLLEDDREAVLLLPAGEDEFCAEFAQAQSEIKRRIFVCFHQPPAWFRLHWRRFKEFNALGGIFCVAQTQVDYFQTVTSTPVHLIRHGVRHDFFCPPKDLAIRTGNRLLFVGQWLRDFKTLANSMPLIWSRRSDVQLDCMVPWSARCNPYIEKLASDRRVRWHAQISDEELRGLYQKSDLLFMPLRESTANNGLLEAMACALPVITTRIGGVPEYFQEGAGELCTPGDVAGHAAAVLKWIANPALRHTAQKAARSHILQNHDWIMCAQVLLKNIPLEKCN